MKRMIAIGIAGFALWTNGADKAMPTGVDRLGGLVDIPARGSIVLASYQSRLTEKDIRSFFLISDRVFQLNYTWLQKTDGFSIGAVEGVLKASAANAAVFLVDDPSFPMTLVSLEGKWGLVNLASLSADKPNALKLGQRAEKLFTRVVTQLLGGGMCPEVAFSAMKPVFTVGQLDGQWAKAIAPAHLQQMSIYIRELGLSRATRLPYYQACLVNLAPAPTNDIQKAIWDKVHQMPTEPMKIKPETKKVRD